MNNAQTKRLSKVKIDRRKKTGSESNKDLQKRQNTETFNIKSNKQMFLFIYMLLNFYVTIKDHMGSYIVFNLNKMYLICTVYSIGKFFNRNCSKLIWQKTLFLRLFSSIGAITVIAQCNAF